MQVMHPELKKLICSTLFKRLRFFRFYLISRVRHPDWPSRDLNDGHVMNYHVIISGYRSITFRTGAPKAFLYIHRSKIRGLVRIYTAYIITPDMPAIINLSKLQAYPYR